MKHIIKRQIIELTVQDPDSARELQEQVSHIYRQRIIPLLDRYCTSLSGSDKLYRIDLLELNLGTLDIENFEEQFIAQVERTLQKALREQITSQEQQTEEDSPKTRSALELFVFFLRTGGLPWWADERHPALLQENLQNLLDAPPPGFVQLLQELIRDGRIRQRLVTEYRDPELVQLCGLLAPAHQTMLKQDVPTLSHTLQNIKTRLGWQPAVLRKHFWSNLLQTASLGGEQYPTHEDFYHAMLQRLATELGMPYPQLIKHMHQAMLKDERLTNPQEKERLEKSIAALAASTSAQALQSKTTFAQQTSLNTLWQKLLANKPLKPETARQVRELLQSETFTTHKLPQPELVWLIELLTQPQPSASEKKSAKKQAAASQPAPPTPNDSDHESARALAAIFQYYQSAGGAFVKVWAALKVLSQQLPAEVQAQWLETLEDADGQSIVDAVVTLLDAPQSLPKNDRDKVLTLLRIAHATEQNSPASPLNLRFSNADELPVGNAGLVILWPFLTSFFAHRGLLDDTRQFKDLASRQRAVGLLQMLASAQGEFAEHQLPLNKVLCGLDMQHVFDFGPPARKIEMRECKDLLKAVITQAPILHNMSVEGFRASFLLRPGLLNMRDGHWLLRVEHQTYDIVLERFPWSWQWLKLPWMESPLNVEWQQ